MDQATKNFYRNCDLDLSVEPKEKKTENNMLSSTSSSSSSPPHDFDVNDREQYMSIYDDDSSLNDQRQQSVEPLDLCDSSHEANVIEPVPLDENKVKEGMLEIKLRALKRKTKTLANLRDSQMLRLRETQKLVDEIKIQVEIEKKSCQSIERKIELMKKHIASRQASVKKRHFAKGELIEELKQHVSRRVFQMASDVFTIDEINLLEQNGSNVNLETSPLLTFSDSSHYQIDQQTAYSIVEPWLPSNGDYSAYSLWVNDNRNGQVLAPLSALSQRNPAFRISAALTYTTQLVNNIAAYLDVILPAKLHIDMFSGEPLNDTQFSYNVAKLNANVIHLCISQGVDISLISPQRTLKNLMFLFNLNISDLGRIPVMEFEDESVAQRIDENISADLALVREELYDFSKFTDDDDVSDSEWEISDNVVEQIEHQFRANEQSIQQNSYIMSRLTFPKLIASFWSGN